MNSEGENVLALRWIKEADLNRVSFSIFAFYSQRIVKQCYLLSLNTKLCVF